jgi:hypothetical protein
MACDQELCPNWSGDGGVCPCALFDIERCDHEWLDRPESDTRECLICGEERNG